MAGYAKVFLSTFEGSLGGKPDDLLVFINILAHSDETGTCDVHPRIIANETGLSEDRVRAALQRLESTDPESRTPDEEGRRLVRLDAHRSWGWRIVNHAKYRAMMTTESKRAKNRERQRKHRECVTPCHASSVTECDIALRGVTPVSDSDSASAVVSDSESPSVSALPEGGSGGDVPDKSRTKDKNNPKNPSVVIAAWVEVHSEKGRARPITAGKEAAAAVRVAEQAASAAMTKNELKDCMNFLIGWDDDWIRKMGRTLTTLDRQLASIRPKAAAERKALGAFSREMKEREEKEAATCSTNATT